MSMSNDELQNLEKAGRFRKQVDKNKEKVMDMLKMNGPEYLPIEAGKAGLVIDEPSLKRRKLEIEDLAEKADIIKRARETQYELSMGRALLERKQGEFFEKQAKPFQIKDPNDPNFGKSVGELIRDTAEENKRQLDAINAILERKGFSEEKIQALQESLASIVEAVDNTDDKKAAKALIGEVAIKLSRMPAYKDDATLLYNSMLVGLMKFGMTGEIEEQPNEVIDLTDDFLDKSFDFEPTFLSRAKSEPKGVGEAKATEEEPAEEAPVVKPSESKSDDVIQIDEYFTRKESENLVYSGKGAKRELYKTFLGFKNRMLKELRTEWSENDRLYFQMLGIKRLLGARASESSMTAEDQKIARKIKQDALKYAEEELMPRFTNEALKGFAQDELDEIKRMAGRGFNESLQQYMSSAKTIDDVARLRNNLRKGITGKGIGLRLPEDIEMFGKKLKKNFTGKGGITTEIHKDFLKKNYKVGKGLNYSKMKPEQLMKNLTLNIASMQAGNTGVKDQINSIIDQMLDRGIIKKSEHKKLWYQYVD